MTADELVKINTAITGTPAERQAYLDDHMALYGDAYRKWIDLTVQYNAASLQRVVIMIPHTVYLNGDKAQNRAIQDLLNEFIHQLIDTLRVEYPALEIMNIPAGDGVFALWELYDLGNMPEITSVQGGDTDSLYTDYIHGSYITYELMHLIWMASLYPQLDIREFDYLNKTQFRNVRGARNYNPAVLFHTWSVDLRQLAYDIVLADPYTGVVDDSQQINHGPVGEWLASSEVQEGASFGDDTTSITGEWYAWDPDGDHDSTPALTLDFGGVDIPQIDSFVKPDPVQTYYQGVWDAPTAGAITVTVGMTDSLGASGNITAEIIVLATEN